MDSSRWHNNPNDPRTWGAPMHPADAQRLDFNQPASNERWNSPVDAPRQSPPAASVPFGDPHGMPLSMMPSFLKDVLAGSVCTPFRRSRAG